MTILTLLAIAFKFPIKQITYLPSILLRSSEILGGQIVCFFSTNVLSLITKHLSKLIENLLDISSDSSCDGELRKSAFSQISFSSALANVSNKFFFIEYTSESPRSCAKERP